MHCLKTIVIDYRLKTIFIIYLQKNSVLEEILLYNKMLIIESESFIQSNILTVWLLSFVNKDIFRNMCSYALKRTLAHVRLWSEHDSRTCAAMV